MVPVALLDAAVGIGTKAVGAGVGAIARKLSVEGQAEDAQNAKDIENLKRDTFGPSKGTQESTVQDAMDMARAQKQSALADVARTANMKSYRGPDTLTAKIVQGTQAQAGQLRMNAANVGAQQAAQEKAAALGRVSARAKETGDTVAGVFGAGKESFDKAGGSAGGAVDFKDWSKTKGVYGLPKIPTSVA